MELRDFICESLRQIVEGVVLAQSAEAIGGHINAKQGDVRDLGGNLVHTGDFGLFTRVDFDVMVSAESSGKGALNLKVWGVGAEAGGDRKAGMANRLVFSVPVRLPDGDVDHAAEVIERRRSEAEQHRSRLREASEQLHKGIV